MDITVQCATCGKPFHPFKERVETARFCSRTCNQKNMVGTITNDAENFDGYIERAADAECWEWKGPLRWNGYGVFYSRRKALLAHRFSYERANGPVPDGLVVCHTCDNRKCVNPDHLWIGTQADNLADMAAKGRAHKGPSVHSEAHPLSKLTAAQAKAIRNDARTAREIAADYGISKSLVWGIKAGRNWKYA